MQRAKCYRVTGALAPACLECGACCFSALESYVRVSGDDHARLGPDGDALTAFIGNRCYMKMYDGHCAALLIDVESARFVCSIYATRPATCRDLARGSPACSAEIHEKSERPAARLLTLRARD